MKTELNHFCSDFRKIAESNFDRTAVVVPQEVGSKEYTYGQLIEIVNKCVGFYKKNNLVQGDVIFALMPNSIETLGLFLASIVGGYGYAPLPCTATKAEIERWISLVKPKLCLIGDLVADSERVFIENSQIRALKVSADLSFAWLKEVAPSTDSAPGAMIFLSTSGTTGDPKAIVLDSNILWSSAIAFTNFHQIKDSELRFWNYLPMSYLGGLFNLSLIPLCVSGSIVIDETFSGKTFLGFWQKLERFDVSALWFVPTIVRGLLSMAEKTAPYVKTKMKDKIRIAFLGTAPIDISTKTHFETTFGVELLENFALSETTFFTSESKSDKGLRTTGSVGKILPYVQVKISPIEDSERDHATKGEILVKSPYLFKGYLQNDGMIKSSLDAEGYFSTGDIGEITNDRLLVIGGRLKDVIKRGGYLVSLRGIEVLAERHPAVKEAVAVKIEHSFYGESFNLYLSLKDETQSTAMTDIGKYLHENLIKYKWPEKIIARSDFPRTAAGKVRKHLVFL